MGNIYIKLLEHEFDDDELIEVLIIRLNTILRFAIKHGVKNNEARNLYNAAFHYGSFIERLVAKKKRLKFKKVFPIFECMEQRFSVIVESALQ